MVGAPADSRYSQDGIPSKLCAYRLGERGLGSGVVFLNFPHVGLSLVLPCALLALFAPVCAVSEENWRDVKGADLRALVQDREFGDGVHFAYVFRTDSTFSGMEMGRKERGTWRIVRDEWCWKWTKPAAAEECYRVQRGGAQVRLMRNGSETWRGTLRKTR